MSELEQVQRFLDALSPEGRRELFDHLRGEIQIHPLEERLGLRAEAILEAVHRASDFTFRMFRGVLAEGAFRTEVVDRLRHWQDVTPAGEHAYDFKLQDDIGQVRVQVKLQRSLAGAPLITEPNRRDGIPSDVFLVETDKSRKGEDGQGEATRGYRFHDTFDILAVSLQPSEGDWSRFRYTTVMRLWPRFGDPDWIYKYQPVARMANADWTDCLDTAVQWFRSKVSTPIFATALQARGM